MARRLRALYDLQVTDERPGNLVGDQIIDQRALLERVEGDTQLLREVVSLFMQESPVHLARMRRALAANDSKELARLAHSLKGSLVNLAARRAVRVAAELERLARDGDLAAAGGACEVLEKEVSQVTRALKALNQLE